MGALRPAPYAPSLGARAAGSAQRIPAGERNAHRATLTDIDTGQIRRKLVLAA